MNVHMDNNSSRGHDDCSCSCLVLFARNLPCKITREGPRRDLGARWNDGRSSELKHRVVGPFCFSLAWRGNLWLWLLLLFARTIVIVVVVNQTRINWMLFAFGQCWILDLPYTARESTESAMPGQHQLSEDPYDSMCLPIRAACVCEGCSIWSF